MSESSVIVIVLPSLVYPYFKLDIEQDEIYKPLLIKQETEWIDNFDNSYFQVILIGSVYEKGGIYYTGVSNTILTA